ncbi:phosphopantetheine-binding protein [Nocardia sp. NPDC059240]|uniref:phosphopantetheine-binding protein n=1 Tax=Nocardia sp. NPDC059240 TaxID=3346786 RepID=UPI00368D84AA
MTNGAAQAVSAIPGEPELRAQLARVLELDDPAELDADADLVLLGLASLEVMRMVGRWNKAGIPADFDRLIETPTLRAWSDYFAGLEPKQ